MPIRSNAYGVDGLTNVDTTARYRLGYRQDCGDSAFVYCQGVATAVAGSWVSFTSAGVTTLAAAAVVGRVGVMLAALDATTKYGWVQTKGPVASTVVVAGIVSGAQVYMTATAGSVDDAVVAADIVAGAFFTSADTANRASVLMLHDAYS